MIGPTNRRSAIRTTFEVVVILAIAFVAQATQFSAKQGRAVLCGDSAQYVASAEALLDPDRTPHFEMRKPGYAFFLAGVKLLFGNMGWGAVACNHILLALLPLLAYALGRHVHGRAVGLLAAVFTAARLGEVVWGNRIMSEALFTWLLSFGLLLFVVGLSRPRARGWMVGAGALLGLGWLTRGAATPIIAAAAVMIFIAMRREWRYALASCVCFSLPILACVVLECSLNKAWAGRFRPSNGTVGATLLLRARHFEGFNLPDTAESSRVLALLPERDARSAYVADHLDVWVARYRAMHDLGMGEWAYDSLMGRVGSMALAGNLHSYLISSLRLAMCHLMRNADGRCLSPVRQDRRLGPLIHPDGQPNEDWDTSWFAYYGLPHLTPGESKELTGRMKVSAATRAPFGGSRLWAAFRYWQTRPMARWSLDALCWLGSVWPGFALIGCALFRLNRKCCAFLALSYVLEALFIGFLIATNERLQFIWIVTDTVLSAGLAVGVVNVWSLRHATRTHRLEATPASSGSSATPRSKAFEPLGVTEGAAKAT